MLYVKISNFLDELANGKCYDTGCSKGITLPIRRDRKVVQNVHGDANRDQTKLMEEYFFDNRNRLPEQLFAKGNNFRMLVEHNSKEDCNNTKNF